MNLPNLYRLVDEQPEERSVLPVGWTRMTDHMFGTSGAAVFSHHIGILALLSKSTLDDGSSWLHLSVSYKGGPPSWDIVMLCKEVFLGAESEAVQVIPKKSEEINLAHCWHIWSPIEAKEAA